MNKAKTITIDYDFSRNKRKLINQLYIAQKMLHNLKPCYARVSSSKNGMHIRRFDVNREIYDDEEFRNYCKFCKPLEWSEEIYDDAKRKLIREIRLKYGLTSNVLFDQKSFRNITRVAGEWQEIKDAADVETFLDFFYDFWRL